MRGVLVKLVCVCLDLQASRIKNHKDQLSLLIALLYTHAHTTAGLGDIDQHVYHFAGQPLGDLLTNKVDADHSTDLYLR